MLVAGGAQARYELVLAGRMPPSPWIGSTRKPAVCSSIAAERGVEIVELDAP